MFGLSSGGTCVTALIGCPQAEGLFAKVAGVNDGFRTKKVDYVLNLMHLY